ncbi:MAG TPA: fructose-bisphosphate aldolase [Candidatus Methylomirabilis sp.]|nr:fructose-bisphosphate aldolase [Candidatus Methylomirabilis sp.]
MKVRVRRVTLDDLGLSLGKRTRLRRILYEHGPGNGTLLLLPIDQGLEHGPRDFFENPDSLDPEYQLRIAREGGYSGIVFQVGLAAKYMRGYEGSVPLVLKLNGKTEIPDDNQALSPCIASVEDAVRLGADAVGYTLYVGSPAQAEDFVQFMAVREEAERFGMPVIIWAYPRGEAIKKKGGRDGLYAIVYAARVAGELGADVVKVNMPVLDPEKDREAPKPYNTLRVSQEEAMERVVRAAGRTMVLVSGGSKISDADLMEKARIAMDAGATGLIFGRNVWQRPHDEALRISKEIRSLLLQYPA